MAEVCCKTVRDLCAHKIGPAERAPSDGGKHPEEELLNYMTLEDILQRYFGFGEDSDIDGPEWVSAYNRLINCIERVGAVTGVSVDGLVRELDKIDSEEPCIPTP